MRAQWRNLVRPGPVITLERVAPQLENQFIKHTVLSLPVFWYGLLELPKIRLVSSVSWAVPSCDQCVISRTSERTNSTQAPCTNCTRARLAYSKGRTSDKDTGEICWPAVGTDWKVSYHSPSWYLKPGYTLDCWCSLQDCATKPLLLNPFAVVLRLLQDLLNFLYLPALASLVLNFVVIAVVTSSKPLRKSPTMILIANVAICDFSLSIWCILTAKFNAYFDSDEAVLIYTYTRLPPDHQPFLLMCPYMAFIFGVTQFTLVMTSLFLTLERYLAVVYCMRPEIRMTKLIAIIGVGTSWSVTLAFNTYSVFFVSGSDSHKGMKIVRLVCSATGQQVHIGGWFDFNVPLSVLFGAFYILVFLCTIPLYIHIFIVVKRSSTQMGIKREGRLARKLVFVILTNFLFTTIPLIIVPFFSSLVLVESFLAKFKTYGSFKSFIICVGLLPVLFLCINSFLNPLLFAFRHHSFKRHFRITLTKTLECFTMKYNDHTGQRRNGRHHRNRSEERANDTRLQTPQSSKKKFHGIVSRFGGFVYEEGL